MTVENEVDWKVKARNSIVDYTLNSISPAEDVRDLELKAFHAVASFFLIKEAKQERLLDDLYGYQGRFEDLKQKTMKKMRMFLQLPDFKIKSYFKKNRMQIMNGVS